MPIPLSQVVRFWSLLLVIPEPHLLQHIRLQNLGGMLVVVFFASDGPRVSPTRLRTWATPQAQRNLTRGWGRG